MFNAIKNCVLVAAVFGIGTTIGIAYGASLDSTKRKEVQDATRYIGGLVNKTLDCVGADFYIEVKKENQWTK